MTHEELVEEMTAARKRVAEKTARAIRDARVVAVRAALPPGATREELEERARSFYPRLDDERIAEVATTILEQQVGGPDAGLPRPQPAPRPEAAAPGDEALPVDALAADALPEDVLAEDALAEDALAEDALSDDVPPLEAD